MSFMFRPCTRIVFTHIVKRQAHKKANIQVKLSEYVEGLGIKDQVVAVRPGLMRNILYPSGKAVYVTKQQASETPAAHDDNSNTLTTEALQQLNEENQKKKQNLLGGLEGVRQLSFKRAVVPNSDHTFGSVTAEDLVSKLKEEYGLDVVKSTIEFKSEGGRIKSLGEHMVTVQVGDETAKINVIVNAAV
ncbi:hypothetical protein K501DRAFT_221936 [Backusella circina FSU 941]|nr:hypothetical protein K501DRAFT_221936 [Backusella circina FSU 941]